MFLDKALLVTGAIERVLEFHFSILTLKPFIGIASL